MTDCYIYTQLNICFLRKYYEGINVEAIRSIWSFKRILAFAKDIYKSRNTFLEHL